MIERESEYRDWLVVRGVGANDKIASSPASYVSYLRSVSKLLNLRVSLVTLASEEDVSAYARQLLGRRATKTIDNYKVAMRAYVAMVHDET